MHKIDKRNKNLFKVDNKSFIKEQLELLLLYNIGNLIIKYASIVCKIKNNFIGY